ncbi:MAG: extracellular solute-binding protein [Candidatus Krumholzibacteria bacterium]|nr:extracellular solute-binding protein [Candidatus Krumholzibacteria bacterium]
MIDRSRFRLVASAAVLLAAFSSCGGDKGGKKEITIFHAGSLSVPLKLIAADFMKENPGVGVLLEAAGSRASARKITDLGRRCDVFASADYSIIDEMLIPAHAAWNIRFAANEMAIVMRDGSARQGEIASDNWFMILLEEDVAFGRSDPDSDPCGYRAIMTMKLAEDHYGIEGLAGRLLAKDTRHVRPKETDLLALLESGTIDYIFLYRSVAKQHGLPYVELPDEVNLGNPALDDYYSRAQVAISGDAPGSVVVKSGESMGYGVTIPLGAPEPEIAMAFVKFLLDESKGMKIMSECGQPSVVPSPSATYDMIPAGLRRFAAPPAKDERKGMQ